MPLWDDTYSEKMNAKVLNFTTVLEKKWSESKRTYDRFIEKNSEWLKKNFILPTDNESSSKSVGRPKTNFNECAERTKINKVKHLVKSYTCPELSYAALAKYQLSGKRCVSQLFKESVKSPNRAKKIMNSYTCVEDKKTYSI